MSEQCAYYVPKEERERQILEENSEICTLLVSPDWKKRALGERIYISSKVRNLKLMLRRYAEGSLDFTPNCSIELLIEQLNAMTAYLNILEIRGVIEKIPLGYTMKHYVGIKHIQAEPLNLGDYNKYRGWTIPENEDPKREGYLVKYPDGYVSWSPKEVFEEAYSEVEEKDAEKVVKLLKSTITWYLSNI